MYQQRVSDCAEEITIVEQSRNISRSTLSPSRLVNPSNEISQAVTPTVNTQVCCDSQSFGAKLPQSREITTAKSKPTTAQCRDEALRHSRLQSGGPTPVNPSAKVRREAVPRLFTVLLILTRRTSVGVDSDFNVPQTK